MDAYDTVKCYLRLVMPKRRRTNATTIKMFIEPSSTDTMSANSDSYQNFYHEVQFNIAL